VTDAMRKLHPYALDVSTGIETDGLKDKQKMAEFAAAVRKEETE
jgi:phosphoribosylanthranilate isomerase